MQLGNNTAEALKYAVMEASGCSSSKMVKMLLASASPSSHVVHSKLVNTMQMLRENSESEVRATMKMALLTGSSAEPLSTYLKS